MVSYQCTKYHQWQHQRTDAEVFTFPRYSLVYQPGQKALCDGCMCRCHIAKSTYRLAN